MSSEARAQQFSFGRSLEAQVGLPIMLRFNENSSTMLSVRRELAGLRVSLHKMFLSAPTEVLAALVDYLAGRQKAPGPLIRGFINEHHERLDYTKRLDVSALSVQGSTHHLQQIYDEVNREYFESAVDLKITWYGRTQRHRPRRRVTFGLYYDAYQLIKIHKMLDRQDVPNFFVNYVVYHEMLHHVLPAYRDANGRNCMHHSAFKCREKEHKYYQQSKQWIRDNERMLFA